MRNRFIGLTLQCVVERGICSIEPNKTVKPAIMSIANPLKLFYRGI